MRLVLLIVVHCRAGAPSSGCAGGHAVSNLSHVPQMSNYFVVLGSDTKDNSFPSRPKPGVFHLDVSVSGQKGNAL